MRDFFDTEESLHQLRAEALAWIGTPFRKWQRAKQAGVDCVQLAGALYIAAGVIPEFTPTGYPMGGGDESDVGLVIEWLTASPHFGEVAVDDRRPGDLLCFRMNKVPHHVGVLLWPRNAGTFIHAARFLVGGTRYHTLADPAFATRLARVFRPVIPEAAT